MYVYHTSHVEQTESNLLKLLRMLNNKNDKVGKNLLYYKIFIHSLKMNPVVPVNQFHYFYNKWNYFNKAMDILASSCPGRAPAWASCFMDVTHALIWAVSILRDVYNLTHPPITAHTMGLLISELLSSVLNIGIIHKPQVVTPRWNETHGGDNDSFIMSCAFWLIGQHL